MANGYTNSSTNILEAAFGFDLCPQNQQGLLRRTCLCCLRVLIRHLFVFIPWLACPLGPCSRLMPLMVRRARLPSGPVQPPDATDGQKVRSWLDHGLFNDTETRWSRGILVDVRHKLVMVCSGCSLGLCLAPTD